MIFFLDIINESPNPETRACRIYCNGALKIPSHYALRKKVKCHLLNFTLHNASRSVCEPIFPRARCSRNDANFNLNEQMCDRSRKATDAIFSNEAIGNYGSRGEELVNESVQVLIT